MDDGLAARACRSRRPRVRATAAVAAVAAFLPRAAAVTGVLHGDTTATLYVNGEAVPQDITAANLRMNSIAQYSALDHAAQAIRSNGVLAAGDELAIFVETTSATRPAAVILALDDGVMTSSQWRCGGVTQPVSSWEFAVEQETGCCDWRDDELWSRFGARWIQPNSTAVLQAFWCRYTLPISGSKLPDSSTSSESATAPVVNMTSFVVDSSVQATISFEVSEKAIVSCGMMRNSYKMRAPTYVELESWGIVQVIADPYEAEWALIGNENTRQDYDVASLAWLNVSSIVDCQSQCFDHMECHGMTYYSSGMAYGEDLCFSSQGCNCKLIASFEEATPLSNLSSSAEFTHMTLVRTAKRHQTTLPGAYTPSTKYLAYCGARSSTTGGHSAWEAVRAAERTLETGTCVDCAPPPEISLLGGWADGSQIAVVVQTSAPGYAYCAAVALSSADEACACLTADEIKLGGHVTVTGGGFAVSVLVTGLAPDALYEVSCAVTDHTGTDSTAENILTTVRRWRTESLEAYVPIAVVGFQYAQPSTISLSANLDALGYLWCDLYAVTTIHEVVPGAAELQQYGRWQRVSSTQQTLIGIFEGPTNGSYDVYCTAVENPDFNVPLGQGGRMQTPFPVATILNVDVQYDNVTLQVLIDRGPASLFCDSRLWDTHASVQAPTPPTAQEMRASPFHVDVPTAVGGTVILRLVPLNTGSVYSIYCYTEIVGSDSEQMSDQAIYGTRRTIRTMGPAENVGGWQCVSGQTCNISGIAADGISVFDRVMVRADGCPGRCRCSGFADPYQKGSACSAISHDPQIGAPSQTELDAVSVEDPNGEWCYVDQGLCPDEVPSPTFGQYLISYRACSFGDAAGLTGPEPDGFPNGGLTMPAWGSAGDSYTFGPTAVNATGGQYELCWCNGTESSCATQADYRLSLGSVHVAGPSSEQASEENSCVAGHPCTVPHIAGYGLRNGGRLAVVPDTAMGCAWVGETPAHSVGVPGFLNDGVSEPSLLQGSSFSWGGDPLVIEGGEYLLCWCGPAAGSDEPCPAVRPVGGAGFLAPAGRLVVFGPLLQLAAAACSIGVECVVRNVAGSGLQGGDRVAVLDVCGQAAERPTEWSFGQEQLPPQAWLSGGWLQHGPQITTALQDIDSVGPLDPCVDAISTDGTEGGNASNTSNTSTVDCDPGAPVDRGVWGFAGGGMSIPNSVTAIFEWGAPNWALAGVYRLCWCRALEGQGCQSPADFLVPIGRLEVPGPLVLPRASQLFRCSRRTVCNIPHLNGTLPPTSQLAVASAGCGSAPPGGVPNSGISEYSPDGSAFTWGSKVLTVAPGEYQLCWCPTLGACGTYADYPSFAAVLQVKGVLSTSRIYTCTLHIPCIIGGVTGQNLDSTDSVMVMSSCGKGTFAPGFEASGGVSTNTTSDGREFTLPAATESGSYRLCWCDGTLACADGRDFATDIGSLEVTGPDDSLTYVCYEWQPCSVALQGNALSVGDMLRVVPIDTDCTAAPAAVHGFPQGGYSSAATGDEEEPCEGGPCPGSAYSWGPGLVRTLPGIYRLCWCKGASAPSGCDAPGAAFPVPAGSIRVGTSAEWQYLQRPPDPEPRGSQETWLPYLLAVPLPFLFCLAIVGGRAASRRRLTPIDPVAFFTKRRQMEHELGQAKDMDMYKINQVLGTRVVALAQLSGVAEGPERSLDAIPDMSGQRYIAERGSDSVGNTGYQTWLRNSKVSSLKSSPSWLPVDDPRDALENGDGVGSSVGSMAAARQGESWQLPAALPGRPDRPSRCAASAPRRPLSAAPRRVPRPPRHLQLQDV